jgi:hypothetical protein
MADANKFVVDLAALVKKAKGNMDLVVRKIVLDTGTRIVMRSPVGDGSLWRSPPPKGYTGGRFRANWQYGEGAIPQGTSTAIDPSGAVSLARIAGVRPEAAGKVHYLTNNLPYAMRLETGWSRQAPGGMVALAVREFQSVVAAAAKAVNP